MQKTALIVLAILALGVLLIANSANQPYVYEFSEGENKDYTHYKFDNGSIYLVTFKQQVKLFYNNQNPDTLEKISLNNNLAVSINGSFFLPSFEHAGFLYFKGETEVPLAPLDTQLSEIVILKENGEIDFKSVNGFNESSLEKSDTAFQTGPLFIKDNVIQTDSINNSTNGNGSYIRTFMGFLKNSRRAFFAITTQKYTLSNLAEYLLGLEIFKDENLTVINLDGGSSTSMYSKFNSSFNFNPLKKIPIILGVE